MNIITISRQFGSGGRELGSRLAATLVYDDYDKEIIAAVARGRGMDEDYVKNAVNSMRAQPLQLTVRNSLTAYSTSPQTALMLEEKKVIE